MADVTVKHDIPSTPADGNVKVLLVPAIADTSKPTVAELTGATAVDISCYLTPDGFNLTVEQATISDERLCSTETLGAPGRKTSTLELTGLDNTNSPYEKDYNALVDTMVEGARLFAVRRSGKPYNTPIATGDKVRIIPFTAGVMAELPPEANSVLKAKWSTFVNGASVFATVV